MNVNDTKVKISLDTRSFEKKKLIIVLSVKTTTLNTNSSTVGDQFLLML